LQGIIDAHIHLSGRLDDALVRFAQMNGLRYNSIELLAAMRKSKIRCGLLLSPPLRNGGIVPNADIVDLCGKSNGVLAPVITVEPTSTEVSHALALAQKIRKILKGFKVRLGYVAASADAAVFEPLYEYAESERLPILFHTGDTAFSTGDLSRSHPLTLDRLANKREELRIVLCHFGNPWFEDTAELIYKHPNVYGDISGLITGESGYAVQYSGWLARKISEAVYFVGGADKVIFGTDYPVTKHSDALGLVKKLNVSERDKEKILWSNAERLFHL
jgi:uncharacterized protein